MSESTSDQEKTESPSSKRLEDARKKGQVPRSREFATFIVLALSLGTIAALAPWLLRQLGALVDVSLRIPPEAARNIPEMFVFFRTVLASAWIIAAPILLAALVAALISPAATNAYLFLPDKVAPDFTKLNPASWFGRVFSKDGAIEIGKGILKTVVIGLIAYYAFMSSMEKIMASPGLGLEGGLVEVSAVIFKVTGFVVLALAALAGADVPLQLWMHQKNQKN
jgi:flagellar biosynthetic protein FlhB